MSDRCTCSLPVINVHGVGTGRGLDSADTENSNLVWKYFMPSHVFPLSLACLHDICVFISSVRMYLKQGFKTNPWCGHCTNIGLWKAGGCIDQPLWKVNINPFVQRMEPTTRRCCLRWLGRKVFPMSSSTRHMLVAVTKQCRWGTKPFFSDFLFFISVADMLKKNFDWLKCYATQNYIFRLSQVLWAVVHSKAYQRTHWAVIIAVHLLMAINSFFSRPQVQLFAMCHMLWKWAGLVHSQPQ